jgi:hypothetical protein
MENYKNLSLNEGQLNAIKVIHKFLNTELSMLDRPYITISGPGGSGKTYMIKAALQNYPKLIKGATISHFAKKVLKDSLDGAFEIYTLASLFKADSYINNEGKFVVYYNLARAKEALRGVSLLVIDEVSMIDDSLFNIIVNLGIKIIAIGDKYQLPPVEQAEDSKFFDTIDAELTEIMRFTGPLGDFSTIFVDEIKEGNKGRRMNKNIISYKTQRISKVNETGSGYIFINKLIPLLKFAAQEFKRNPESLTSCRIIAYKNNTIDDINFYIRKLLYGKNVGKYVVNELLISDGGYNNIIKNGDIFRIINIKKGIRSGDNLRILYLYLVDKNDKVFKVEVLNEDDEENLEAYNKTIEKGSNKAKATHNWEALKKFKASFAKFKYSYAVSVHKIQGSSIENVYVFEGEIMGVKPISIKEKFQSLYVAVTRATHRTYIYNPTQKVINNAIKINLNRFKNESTKNIS